MSRGITGVLAIWILALPIALCAQQVSPDIVDLPSMGRVDLNQVAPEWRANLRIPGQVHNEPPEGGPETVYRRRLQLTGGGPVWLEGQTAVANPPGFPAGFNATSSPAVATDTNSNVAIGWIGNVTAGQSSFAKGFNSSAAVVKNDFRPDLGGRAVIGSVRATTPRQACVGGTNQNLFCTTDADCPGSTCGSSGRFPFAWRDTRGSNKYDIYARAVQALQ